MPRRLSVKVVAISGPLCAGKTTTAVGLNQDLGFETVSVRLLLMERAGTTDVNRADLEEIGTSLDRDTEGAWLADAVAQTLSLGVRGVIVDAVRTPHQRAGLHDAFGSALVVVHLTASASEREARFERRRHRAGDLDAEASYVRAASSAIEVRSEDLAANAALVMDTTSLVPGAPTAVVLAYVRGLA